METPEQYEDEAAGTATSGPDELGADEAPASGAPGQGSPADGLYDLSTVPEHLHEHLLPIVKDIEGNVTRRFQEAAEYRKNWEPYEGIGLDDFEPSAIEQLLAIGHLAQDEEQFNEWLLATADARQLLEPEGEDYDDYGDAEYDEDYEYEGAGNGRPADYVLAMQERLEAIEQALEPIAGRFEAQDQQEAMQQMSRQIDGVLDQIEKEHGSEINRDRVLQLSLAYSDRGLDSIRQGFEDWKQDRTEIERGMFDRRRGVPSTPERGGTAASNVEAPQTFEEAAEAAKEIMRRSRAG